MSGDCTVCDDSFYIKDKQYYDNKGVANYIYITGDIVYDNNGRKLRIVNTLSGWKGSDWEHYTVEDQYGKRYEISQTELHSRNPTKK